MRIITILYRPSCPTVDCHFEPTLHPLCYNWPSSHRPATLQSNSSTCGKIFHWDITLRHEACLSRTKEGEGLEQHCAKCRMGLKADKMPVDEVLQRENKPKELVWPLGEGVKPDLLDGKEFRRVDGGPKSESDEGGKRVADQEARSIQF